MCDPRLFEALNDILRQTKNYKTPDIPEFKGLVTEAFWEFKDRGIKLDCEFVQIWLAAEGCPENNLDRITSWCKSIKKGGRRYRGLLKRYWAEDIWEKWSERAHAKTNSGSPS